MKKSITEFLKNTWKHRAHVIMALPAFLIVFFIMYVPMTGLVMAFKKFDYTKGIYGSPWNGLDNFKFLLASKSTFISMTKNTILYYIVFTVVGTFLNIVLAIAIDQCVFKKMAKAMHTLMIIPVFISYAAVQFIVYAFLSPLGDINDLSLLIRNMSSERYSANEHREESIQLYLKLFFYKLSEKLHAINVDNPNSYYEKMSIIRTKIYNKPYYDWNVEGMAHQLAMSKSYFQHLYKEIFGISVMNDVIQSRIDHAKYLLSTTDISIVQVAEMCGYKCTSHFMRQFKNKMKMTPSEYRKKMAS